MGAKDLRFREDFLESDTDLHCERILAVTLALRHAEAQSVLDLGCGTGELLARLCEDSQFSRLVGLDRSIQAIVAAERRLARAIAAGRVALYHGSFDLPHPQLPRVDAAVMVETIEHLEPQRLSALEHVLFAGYRPATVLITTPNRDYNALYGMPEHAFRHPEHRFEWTRGRFHRWASGAAARQGYGFSLAGVGARDLVRGCPTQMAIFRLGK